MFPQWQILAAGGVTAMLLIGGAYFKGRSDENALAQANARRAIVEQITERNQINEAVSNMSAADLCSELGGVFVNGQCD